MNLVRKQRYQLDSDDEALEVFARGEAILNEPLLNKGTAFSLKERNELGLRGLVPPKVTKIEEQVERVLENYRRKTDPLEKFIFLTSLHDRNETLYYRVLMDNLMEMTPIVYTPVVGAACQQFGHIYRKNRGMYLSMEDKGHIREMFDNWKQDEVDIIVISDGSRILGLGDLGANGMGIPIGKLALYVAGGGIFPCKTLPILLDAGTNNQELLDDPLYLGLNQKRGDEDEYYALVDEFVNAVQDKWPKALIQWEDFTNNHAFPLLNKYREKVLCFNDDIQGTGAVALSGLLGGMRMKGEKLADQRIVFYGAGSAAVGIADMIVAGIVEESGMTDAEARKLFWLIDSQGLVVKNGPRALQAHKVPYARDEKLIDNLLDVIKMIKPTILIGVSGQGQAFSKEIIQEMFKYVKQPIIFSLSNPTSKSECTAEQAYKWTKGKAIFASGSPFDPVRLNGKIYVPGQGNNMFIFPGVGLGASLCQASKITDGMFYTAAKALAEMVTEEELALGTVYPDLSKIRKISATIATGICEMAFAAGLAGIEEPPDIHKFVKDKMYQPVYPKYAAADR
ncbi:MAG: NAD-dependent malic enzyme [Candidatus Marinimicrobia bacterium]|nr:NAD-dependent malic enzyme [Candidatus Neomarinimicrobiota bacterium]